MNSYSPDRSTQWRWKPRREWWQWILFWTFKDPNGWISLDEPLQKDEKIVFKFYPGGTFFGIMCHACGKAAMSTYGIVHVLVLGQMTALYHAEHVPDVEYR